MTNQTPYELLSFRSIDIHKYGFTLKEQSYKTYKSFLKVLSSEDEKSELEIDAAEYSAIQVLLSLYYSDSSNPVILEYVVDTENKEISDILASIDSANLLDIANRFMADYPKRVLQELYKIVEDNFLLDTEKSINVVKKE